MAAKRPAFARNVPALVEKFLVFRAARWTGESPQVELHEMPPGRAALPPSHPVANPVAGQYVLVSCRSICGRRTILIRKGLRKFFIKRTQASVFATKKGGSTSAQVAWPPWDIDCPWHFESLSDLSDFRERTFADGRIVISLMASRLLSKMGFARISLDESIGDHGNHCAGIRLLTV